MIRPDAADLAKLAADWGARGFARARRLGQAGQLGKRVGGQCSTAGGFWAAPSSQRSDCITTTIDDTRNWHLNSFNCRPPWPRTPQRHRGVRFPPSAPPKNTTG